MRPLDVITCGEAMALFSAQRPGALEAVHGYARGTAGAELNVAIGLARLGLAVGYLSRVGDDMLGRHLLAVMAGEGIDCSQVAVDPRHPTGLMFKSRSDDGSDPKVEYHRRGSAASHLSTADAPAGYVARARHVHLTGISPALAPNVRELVFAMARDARAAGKTVSFDPNLRPVLWPSESSMVECLDALAACSDWVLPGHGEGRRLTGRDTPEGIADHYLANGARIVVVKLGTDGAYYAAADGLRGRVPAVPVDRVVDTVGAGDGFAVGVISGLLEGLALPDAVARGAAIGARVVQFPGDCDGLPTRRELGLAPR